MIQYVVLPFNKKLNLLRSHSTRCQWPTLDQENWCLHCGKKFSGRSVRVRQSKGGALCLECGTPGCDGSPSDWAPFPYWDPKDPDTQRELQKKAGHPRSSCRRKLCAPADDDLAA